MKPKSRFAVVFSFCIFACILSSGQPMHARREYAAVLKTLCDALITRQDHEKSHAECGSIACAHCRVLHTRAAEAMYPFALEYTIARDARYLSAAILSADWLIGQQQPNGSWKETPEEWTGTSTDQLLMMLLTYPIVLPHLSEQERERWRSCMRRAADYLSTVMTPEFASINYVATTTATLAKANELFGNPTYLEKATALAHRVVAKLDEDGFVTGEGGRTHNIKSGVDLGYAMEMSLWGLGYYARLTGDRYVDSCVKRSLKTHLFFIYPDGSMDGSWGIRSNKWTTYGGVTSDGCQALFALYAKEDPAYVTAALKNLRYLKTNIKEGIIGYGPQQWEVFSDPPCIYPTFTKAKNIAFAYMMDTVETRMAAQLPAEREGWMRHFRSVDVAEIRTHQFMATITAYGYKDYASGSKSKYMYRPSGGAISNLWIKDHGYFTASSATVYSRPEPMTFPEAPGTRSLTPRIEYTDTSGYYTNLFEFDSHLYLGGNAKTGFTVNASGELKDKNWFSGGVGYRLDYVFTDNQLRKSVTLVYHDTRVPVSILEPVIDFAGTRFDRINDSTLLIVAGKKKLEFRLLSGNAELLTGKDRAKYWTPFPALKANPVELVVKPGAATQQTVVYTITVLE